MMQNAFDWENMNMALATFMMYSMGADIVEKYMKHPEMKRLLESKEKFDVCVFEVFGSDSLMVRFS